VTKTSPLQPYCMIALTHSRSTYRRPRHRLLAKAIEELAAGRPRDAVAMVANAQGSLLALRGMIEGQISHDELGTFHNTPQALGAL
jgi:hypothetical protein